MGTWRPVGGATLVPALALVTVAGAVLRVAASSQGLFADELFSYAIADRPSLRLALSGVGETENTPPLFYVLAWAVAAVSDVPQHVRLPSLVAGVATVPVVALIARRIAGGRAALVAGAITASSPFLVYYSSEARSYALAVLAVAVSTLALLHALDGGGRRAWVILALSAAAGAWFHYVAVLPIVGLAGWAFLARPECRREVVLSHAAAGALFAPWLPFAGQNVPLALIADVARVTPSRLLDFPLRTLLGYPYRGVDAVPGVVAAIALGLGLGTAVLSRRGRVGIPGLRSATWGLAAAVFATLAGLIVYSLLRDGIFLPRNLAVALPAALALLAVPLARARTGVAVSATVVIVAVLAITAARVSFGDLRRPAWDEAAAVLDREARPADPVIELTEFAVDGPLRGALRIFLTREHPIWVADGGAAGGWAAGVRRGRVFAVFTEPDEETTGDLLPLPRFRPDPRFVELRRWEWPRRDATLVLAVYRPRGTSTR